jgi:hypothetical protein
MGGNGSKSQGTTETEKGRRWKTVEVLPNGVEIIEFKNKKTPTKMPEESHSPNAIYGMMFKKGNGLKSISIYDSDCKKIVEIHNEDHDGLGPHYHYWKNGRPVGEPQPISKNPQYQQLLNETINLL